MLLLQFPPQPVDSVDGFSEKLHRFLGKLPRDLLYAIELRNPELLSESYIQAIGEVRACHCFNVHPTMPSLEEQARRVDATSLPAVVVRWMLRRNRTYGDAKDAFYPFNRLAEPDTESRKAIAALCRNANRAFVIVNNKAEGCAPLSRAWDLLAPDFDLEAAAANPDRYMWAWDGPSSVASGILDDVTHDWLTVIDGTRRSGGQPIVVPESQIERAGFVVHAVHRR